MKMSILQGTSELPPQSEGVGNGQEKLLKMLKSKV